MELLNWNPENGREQFEESLTEEGNGTYRNEAKGDEANLL